MTYEEREQEYYKIEQECIDFTNAGKNPEDILILIEKGQKLALQYGDQEYDYFFQSEKAVYTGDLEKAKVLLRHAIHQKQNSIFYRCLGVVVSQLEQSEEAISYFDQALALNPKDYNSHREKGILLANSGRNEEAISYFDQALALNPKDYNSHREKGITLTWLGRNEEAISYFDQALALNPKDYNSYREKGVSLSYLERYEEELSYYDRALALNPNDSRSYREKGRALAALGR